MKLLLATTMLAVTMLANAPATAQTSATSSQIPNTTLSTAPTPSTGPRAQEGNVPSNSAASANNSALATDPTGVSAAPAMMSYPICKAGEFDHCLEPDNGPRQPVKKRARRHRH